VEIAHKAKQMDGPTIRPRAIVIIDDESGSIRAQREPPGPRLILPGVSHAQREATRGTGIASLTAPYRELARWLLRHEMDDGPTARTPVEAAERVAVRLSGGVSSLVSQDGYRALLKRALYLVRAEYGDLGVAGIGTSDIYLDGLREQLTEEALVSLFAQVIALLARFVGDDLTGNLIRQRWPQAPTAARGCQRSEEGA